MKDLKHIVEDKFIYHFKTKPHVFRSPGRVNLIGEHTDYNGGFVLPAAIDKAAYLAILPSKNQKGIWFSENMHENVEVDFDKIIAFEHQGWANYILGVIEQFKKRGFRVRAFDCVLAGDVPIGSGMSSSAALESAMAFAINEIFGFGLDKKELTFISQQAENEFIGIQCGIMDMFASIHGKKDHVMLLDCETLEFEYFPLDLKGYKIVLFDSAVKHNLVETEYNLRREQCAEGLAFFRKNYDKALANLSQLPLDVLYKNKMQLSEVVYKRCQYVVEENARILGACSDLKAGNLVAFGKKMTATHAGLRDLYEVSCPELDFLVEAVKNETAVLGSRLMGGGFGGCTINLVKADAVDELFEKLALAFEKNTGKTLKMYEVLTADGASKIK